MEANLKYIVTYDSFGDISIDDTEDSSLAGFTVLCCRNQGPDELALSLATSFDSGDE